MEFCDRCGKMIELREKSVLDDGIYHQECADEVLEMEDEGE